MSSQSPSVSPGQLIANSLARFWQDDCSADLSVEQLDEVTPLLYGSGAAGLGWWQIRNTELSQTASGELLHQAFRLLALQAAIHETNIQKIFKTFREAGIEPILIKGWAVTRMYPHSALRPYGDIDLIIRPGDYLRAVDIAQTSLRECQLDLHTRPFEVADRSLEDLFTRSQLSACGEEQVRVPSAEDHLALLAIHLLKHGAWRPLWLCDVAMLLEARPSDFNWSHCLGVDARRANWIMATVGLAERLLDVSINDDKMPAPSRPVPHWLLQTVLKAWDKPFAIEQAPHRHQAPISTYVRRPRGLLRDLARRWPDPIIATISVNGTFGSRRRKRYEVGNWFLRARRTLASAFNAPAPAGG